MINDRRDPGVRLAVTVPGRSPSRGQARQQQAAELPRRAGAAPGLGTVDATLGLATMATAAGALACQPEPVSLGV